MLEILRHVSVLLYLGHLVPNTFSMKIYMHNYLQGFVRSVPLGDELLERATRYYETVDINMVWEIIDWYKQAILLARELDIEQEAIAMQRIGRVYAKVLKFKPQAKEYYKRAIQLAVSMAPRIFTACGI